MEPSLRSDGDPTDLVGGEAATFSLQWSRRFAATETQYTTPSFPTRMLLQWSRRFAATETRGKIAKLSEGCESFNGAVASQRRRLHQHPLDEERRHPASMEPSLRSDGDA